MRSLSLWAVACVTAALITGGCENDLGEVRGPVGDDPPLADWSDAARPAPAPADDAAPTIAIDEATLGEDGQVTLVGTAGDDRGVTAVRVDVGHSGPFEVQPRGRGFGEWRIVVPAPAAGPIALRATAFDGMGNTAVAEAGIERPMPDDDTPPTVTIVEPVNGHQSNMARLFVTGTAEDDSAVADVSVALRVDGDEMPLGRALTADFFGNWSLGVPLPPATAVTYVVRATDVAGNTREASVEVVSRAAPPHEPPRLAELSPPDGSTVDTLLTTFEFVFESDAPLDYVAAGRVDGPLFEAIALGDRPGAYTADVWLVPGRNDLRVISRDADGLVARHAFIIQQNDGFGDLVAVDLRAPGEPGGRVDLELDKDGVEAMFPPDVQAQTLLMELDAGPLVENALSIIRESCGVGWEGPHFVNGAFLLDCPRAWGQAERNLWGLLTMTASNVDVSGTSLGFLPPLVPGNLGPDFAFGLLLGQALGLPDAFTPVLGAEPLTEAIIEALIATHPESTEDGKMPVSLLDGLADMTTLADKFDAVEGVHPGFIDEYVEAAVLTDDFRMVLGMRSNLTLYEGVDLEAPTKRYFADRDPANPVVGLEFLEIDDFDLEGIAPAPEVAMNFRMVESDLAATPGRRLGAGDGSLPDGRGNSDVWGPPFEPWMLEHVVALASQYGFGDLRAGCDRCADPALLWLAGFDQPECPVQPDGQYDELACNRFDFAEITIGRSGYDCSADRPCTNFLGEANPTSAGLTEHMGRLVQDHCLTDGECQRLFGQQYRCDDFGICFDRDAPGVCFVDAMCPGGQSCVGGACQDAPAECVDERQCDDTALCYQGRCVDVPAGWFRLWTPELGSEVFPSYMWDVVLEVAQARMRDGVAEGEGDVVFELEGVPVGLDDVQIEALVRQSLQDQAEWLSDALLGSYADNNPDVDLYLDRFDGESWLVLNPCRTATAFPDPCDAPGAGLFDDAGRQLDGPTPNGATGVPLADLEAGMALFYQGRAGTPRRRLDVRAIEIEDGARDRLLVWLRQ